MTLDEVDIQVLLLDRVAAARVAAGKPAAENDSVEAAVAEAMGGAS